MTSLETMAKEIAQAHTIVSPATGVSDAAELTMTRLNYGSKVRYEPSAWIPERSSDLLTVTYRLDGEHLVRDTTNASKTLVTEVVAKKIVGFSVSRPSDQRVDLNATIQESRKIETIQTVGYKWTR
jgi:hypothetical protein